MTSVESRTTHEGFALSPLAPNPVHSEMQVAFVLPRRCGVRLSVLDVQGREVALLTEGEREAGRHTAALDARALRAGLYLVRLHVPGADLTRKLIVTR